MLGTVAQILSKVKVMAPFLKKLTSREVTAEMVIQVADALGLPLDVRAAQKLLNYVQSEGAKYKNMYDLLVEEKHVTNILTIARQGATVEEIEQEHAELEANLSSLRCPHCFKVFSIHPYD